MRHRALVLVIAVLAAIIVIAHFAVPVRAPESTGGLGHERLMTELARQLDAGQPLTTPVMSQNGPRGGPAVTFLAKADGNGVPRIVSDVTGWGERKDGSFDFNAGKMTRVAGTSWYSLEAAVEPSARIEYLIVHGASDYQLDPHNSRSVQRVGGPASEFVMPGYAPPQEFVDPPVQPAGEITEAVLDSAAIGNPRRIIIYTPPGYTSRTIYPLAVFHDGALMVNTGQAPRVLDWLIAHKAIEPIVAVFVDPKSRTDDFRRGAPMRTFVTAELLPWVAARYSVTSNAGDRAIIGVSAGARAALDTASSAGAFNRVGLLIPALDSADIAAVPAGGDRRLRVAIVAAHYDALNRAAARAVQQAAFERGHAVEFLKVPEGHSTATWRTHLRDVLISLFGKT